MSQVAVAATPARPFAVLRNSNLLLLFAAALFFIARGLFTSPVDGPSRQRELFGAAPPPFGLALESALRLPTGDTLVRFTTEADGPGPLEVLFVEYRERAAVTPLFRPAEEGGQLGGAGALMAEWEKEKAFDWRTPRKRGEIAWGEWSTKLLIERSFQKGGGWSEEARVDLSSPVRSLVLFARWPEATPVDETRLRALLDALALAPLAE